MLLACVCVLSACSKSSSSKSTTTETIGNSVPIVAPTAPPVPPISRTACSLVTATQVKTLLGAAAIGVESGTQTPVYKTCNWATTPAGAVSANKLYLGVIRIGNGEVGFGSAVEGLSETVLRGVGDAATYSAGRSSTGTKERLLVTKKGTVSVSISALYGTTVSPPSSVQQDLTAVARAIFADLHA